MDVLIFVGLAPPAIVMVVVTAVRLWSVRSRPVAQAVMVYLFFAAGLLTSNLLELVAASDRWTLLFAQTNYIFLFGVAVSWFAFAVVYSGREEWARSGTTIPLAGLFVIALGIVFTAESHGLFWSEIAFIRQGPFKTLHATYGPLFWVVGTTLYAVLLFGTGTLIRTAMGLPLWYRRQARILVAAAVVPLGFNLMYVLRVVPWLDKDFTPLMYALSGIGFYLSMERHGLVRQRPIARALLLEDIQSGVIVIDADGWISDLNPEARRILSAGTGEAVGVGSLIDGVPALRALLTGHPLDRIDRFTATRETATGESRTGETESFDVTIRPAHDGAGRFVATIVTLHDTTAWHRLQEEREALQLHMVYQERLATVGQLAAGVAHEVNNPLTSLVSVYRAVSEIAGERGDGGEGENTDGPGRTREELADLNAVFQRSLDRIVSALRGLMESAQPARPGSFVPVDLHELVEESLQLARPRYRRVAVIEREFHELPPVEVDPASINQVLLNIIINAAQAIEGQAMEAERARSAEPTREPGTIWIETRDRGDEVECTITNSGPPIPPETASRIFEPFFTTKPRGTGTGLGLAISRHIVEDLHAGTLRVVAGETAGFTIRLPVRGRVNPA
jgi:two-component system, NtrC family, sensor kinase